MSAAGATIVQTEDRLCLQCVLSATKHRSQRRSMSPFELWLVRCGAGRITVMDCGSADNTCVNSAWLFAEPCRSCSGLSLIERVKPADGRVSHCARGGEHLQRLKETRILAKRRARLGLSLEHLRARPTPHEMGLRLVCVEEPVPTRPSQRDKP